MKLVEVPRKKEVVIVDEESVENFYDKDELKLFLQCAQSHGNYKAFALLRLLTFSGMRKNEAAALFCGLILILKIIPFELIKRLHGEKIVGCM